MHIIEFEVHVLEFNTASACWVLLVVVDETKTTSY